jgi:hypothetical protein
MTNHRMQRPQRIETIEINDKGKEIIVIKYEEDKDESDD